MVKRINGAIVWDFVHDLEYIETTAQVDVDWANDRVRGVIDFGPKPEQRHLFVDGSTEDIVQALAYLFKNGFAWCDDCETDREHHDWIGFGFVDATAQTVYEHSPFTPDQLERMGPFRPQSMQCYWTGFDAALLQSLRNAST